MSDIKILKLKPDNFTDYFDERYVDVTGDTMTGDLNMGTNVIYIGVEDDSGYLHAPDATTDGLDGTSMDIQAGAGLGSGDGGSFEFSSGTGGTAGDGGYLH